MQGTPLGQSNFLLRRAAGIKHPRQGEKVCKQKKDALGALVPPSPGLLRASAPLYPHCGATTRATYTFTDTNPYQAWWCVVASSLLLLPARSLLNATSLAHCPLLLGCSIRGGMGGLDQPCIRET